MQYIKKILLLISILSLVKCYQQKEGDNELVKANPIIINIQPFTDIPAEHVLLVQKELLKISPVVHINKAIEPPKSAYYSPRNRYRAESLIHYLRGITPKGYVTIGMTTKDISTTKGKIQDYGIMGLGYQPGASCVVSTFRLNKKNLTSQFLKLCLHELGHTQGLPHCKVKTCFMRDAEGKNYADEEKEFCPDCKSHLASLFHFPS